MKTKQLFSALILSLGMAAFTCGQARAQIAEAEILDIAVNGLKSGSVDIEVTNAGKTYYFTANGNYSGNGFLVGTIPFAGTEFDIKIIPHDTNPRFMRFGGAAYLYFDNPQEMSTHGGLDLMLIPPKPFQTHITVFFQDPYL